jgi:NADH:ubiquinone reductase (H+-translocating)
MANKNQNEYPQVVIVGAGFGGLRVARALAPEPVRATLVDRNNYHLFQPLLYQVATSMLAPDQIAYPVRATLRRDPELDFHLGEVREIDLADQCVITNQGSLRYDTLVLALGGETNYFGLDNSAPGMFGLKTLSEAAGIRNHLLMQFEKAVKEIDPVKRQALLTFVIVGGGPTGVECAGAISELVRIVLKKDFLSLDWREVKIILIEADDSLLSALPAELGKETLKVLLRKHVDVRFKLIVQGYDGEKVSLRDGTAIPANTLIWAAGVRASRLLDSLGFEQDRLGRIKVTPSLQVPGHPEIFVIGDAACLEGPDGKPLPMVAPVAMQQALTSARNIIHLIKQEPVEPFQYRDPGTLATIGRNQAVAQLGRWKFHGFVAWLLWAGVHIYQLVGFRNRLAVLLNWAWDYLFYDRAVRLIEGK